MPFRRLPSIMIGILAMTLQGTAVFAQGSPSLVPGKGVPGCDFVSGKIGAACIPQYIAYLISTLFSLTGAVFLIMIILGGYQYMLGSAGYGNKEEGIARIRFAIIGFLITALSFYIVEFILDSIG